MKQKLRKIKEKKDSGLKNVKKKARVQDF